MKFFGWILSAGEKTLHVVEDIPAAVITLEKMLVDGQKIAPDVKAGLKLLVQDAEAIALAGAPAVLARGGNLLADAATVAATEKLVKDFIAFLPVLEAAGKVLFGDVQAGIAAAPVK